MRRIGPIVVAGSLGMVLSLASCGGDPVHDTSEDVSFHPCSEVECAGTLPSGAEFDVIMPVDWNGTLAIYSHALVSEDGDQDQASPSPTPAPSATASEPADDSPGRSPSASREPRTSPPPSPAPSPTASPSASPRPGGPQLAPLWADGNQALVDVMLQAGYAIAGAAPTGPGWDVGAQLTAARELHQYFVDTVGDPNRTYLWGESTGGLASVRLAETDDWVSGALAFCAPMSGPVQSYNLALDVAYAVRRLILSNLRLTGYPSAAAAEAARNRIVEHIRQQAAGSREERAEVVFIAAMGALPNRSRSENGTTLESQLAANADGIAELAVQSTVQRQQFEQLVGGNPSGNAGTDYSLRVSDAQRAQIDSLVPGVTDRLLAAMASGKRVTPDPEAVERAAAQGGLSADPQVPVLTVHNVFDPVYIVQNESWYAAAVAATGPEAQGNLVNAFVYPPRAYSATSPASEGVGNCDFAPRTLFGGLLQLNRWVREGEYPGRDSVGELFRGQSVTLDYEPAPWPQMSGVPLPDEGGAPAGSSSGTATSSASADARAPGDPSHRSTPPRHRD